MNSHIWEMIYGALVWPAGAGGAPAAAGAAGQAAPNSSACASSAPGAAAAAAPALPNGVRPPASAAGGDVPLPAAEASQQAAGATDSIMAPLDELEDGPAPAVNAHGRDGGRGRGGQRAPGGGRKGRGGGGGRAGGSGSTTALPDAVLAAVRGGFDSCILAAPGRVCIMLI